MLIKEHSFFGMEDKRLNALNSYNILDTLPEKEYDAIARLASYICQTPIATISLIDAERQWIKSKLGIDVDEVPRADAFCNHTIKGDDILEIPDTYKSELVKDNKFVTATPSIRFYAGAPLIDPDGMRLGSLCVVDMVPRKLTAEQRDALRTLADEVMSHLILRKQKKELENNLARHHEFYNLFNNSHEIHCITDRDFNIELINKAVTTILGYDVKRVKGQPIWNFFSEESKRESLSILADGLRHQKRNFEIETFINATDGSIRCISWSLDFNNNKWYASGRDITHQKEISAELERLSLVATKSPTGMIVRDNSGCVIWMNKALETIFGYTVEEMKGQKFGMILHGEETDEEIAKKAIDAFQKSEPYEIEIKLYKKDGTPIWAFLSNSPYRNESGTIEYQVGVVVDITKRKNAQEQINTLSLVASSTTSGVVINDKHGKVQWVSKAFEKITGYQLEDTQNKALGDVLKGALTDVSVIDRSRELSRNKQSFEVDLQVYRKDGEPIWVSIINSVILDSRGEVDKYIEVLIDITDKKKAELELVAAKEEALQLSRAKDMFISVMSHEIRTPLNAVIGMSHLLQESNPLESQKENLGILKFSAENLMHLINDVLDFTKIETGNIELEATDMSIRELVQGVTNSMKYKVGGKNISLKHNVDNNIPEIVIGDRTRLCQILLNLVGNSVKFTEKGGITLDIRVNGQTDKEVSIRFAVIDTGIGIAHNKIDTIFESFKQAEADTTRKYGGTGLGLAITKRLVELHDSQIHVDSEPGYGSTFWFIIKFTKGQSHDGAININHIVETALQLNILVVDDNQINRLLINKVLRRWGVEAEFAENGVEAVSKIESNRKYDVVLMDIHMPEMGGIEATQIIRAKNEEYFKQLPIVALTASLMSNEIEAIKTSGMNDYILKPFEPKGLYDKLSNYQRGMEVS